VLTRTEPAIHNPNVDGLNMISSTLWRSRVPGVHTPTWAIPSFVASIAFLALLGWGQHTASSAAAFSGTPAGSSQFCAPADSSVPPFVLPAAFFAGCAPHSQSASLQPEAMTPTAHLTPPARSAETHTASSAPEPHLAGSGVSVIWLVPLGVGIVVLGALFVVMMYRHRHDDID